ncbi:2-succinylbenzoate--CoA ligase [Paraliobacillus sp. PM-2]|uniref:o-succinylbenzoate--CoA ligase n=1 Tax=Paraliobacillus sp. PM-2 TaxID=1462524 RepID=UPI00061CB102|nr:o-succinylbenzoate--CoA ligase [Paraliobacillus sp. PM-2]CQR48204.1 2-succinylbenzoate--CoA ligase [Paraliobacillus sp. PM-2]
MGEKMPNWLDKQAELNGDETAIESPSFGKLSFREVRDRARLFARKLHSLGVKEGTHVAIYTDSRLDFIVAVHALSYIHAVAVLLNTRLTQQEIQFQIMDADVSFLLVDKEKETLANDLSVEKNITSLSFAAIHQLPDANYSLHQELDLDDVYTIIYTSGTTGNPKGVLHTYGNHWWSAISSMLNLGLDKQDKWLATLPLFHVGGFSLLMKNIIYGMPIYLLDRFEPKIINHAIMNKGVTIVSVVSVMLDRLMEQLEADRYPTSFRCMLLGGGPASEQLLNKAKSYHIPVFQTYGMTETASQVATLSPNDALRKIGSAGKALFSAEVKISHNKEKASPQVIGEIFVKGPMVTQGYYKDELVKQDDWLPTGDLGYLDEEGFLYVVDRRNDLIISGGENIYPAEIENVLLSIEGVVEAGVVGKEDPQWGKVPVAFVVVNQAFDLNIAKEVCNKALAKYKVPKAFYIVDALPRNASNKLLRHQLATKLNKIQ